jgi:hypothetical protein
MRKRRKWKCKNYEWKWKIPRHGKSKPKVLLQHRQSSVDKTDFSRQLRSKEKDAEEVKGLASEVETLRSLKTEFEAQLSDLKDMVKQTRLWWKIYS